VEARAQARQLVADLLRAGGERVGERRVEAAQGFAEV
jgi:hypothetical protein